MGRPDAMVLFELTDQEVRHGDQLLRARPDKPHQAVGRPRVSPAKPAQMPNPVPFPKVMPQQRALPAPEAQQAQDRGLPADVLQGLPNVPVKERPAYAPLTRAVERSHLQAAPVI